MRNAERFFLASASGTIAPPFRRVLSAMRRIRSLLLCLVFAGCAADGAERRPVATAPTATVADSAGVRLVTISGAPEELPVWCLAAAPLLTIDGGTTGDSTALSRVGPVMWLASGGLVVHDPETSRLLVFEADGRFVRALGRDGAGPGEMEQLTTLAVQRGDTITTWDSSLRRLSYWHPSTGYVRQLLVNESDDDVWYTMGVWSWQDSLLVVLQNRTGPRPTPPAGRTMVPWPTVTRVALRDLRGRTVATSSEFAGSPIAMDPGGTSHLAFANLPFVALGPSAVHVGSGIDFSVAQLSSGFALVGTMRWPAAQEPMSADEVDRVREATTDVVATYLPIERARDVMAPLFEPHMLPAQRPALKRALVDEADRVWLERFEPRIIGTPRQLSSSRWTVLAADGTPLAAFVLPPRTRLEGAQGDRVVVVHRDSTTDLESVAVYRLDTNRP